TEFVPIVIMGRVPNALVVNAKVPLASVADVIAYAKANPGRLTCATQGNGTTSHLTAELFQMMADVKFQQVPYRGSAPALTDLAAGNVDLMFGNPGVSVARVKGGQLKLLGVATPNRMAALPQVPTIAQTLGGFESAAWFAIVAPPKTPAAVVDKINADVNEALREGEVRERLAQLSAEPIGGTPQATAAYMREEIERWHKGIKAANVKLEGNSAKMTAATVSFGTASPSPSNASLSGLDGVNFFLAGILAGFGPYVAADLAEQKWTQESIGFVLTASGLAGLLSQLPGGELLDTVPSKRAVVVAGVAMVAVSAIIITLQPSFPLVFTALMLQGSTGGFLGPAIAAISLGLVGHAALPERLGRNQRFSSTGNLVAAAL